MAKPPSEVTKGRKSRDQPDSFDRWLDEGLHKLYDDVVQAPVPEALLALIESHRAPSSDPVVTPDTQGQSPDPRAAAVLPVARKDVSQ